MRIDRKPLAELLPAIYRIRDREEGEPLLRLLSVIAEQIEVLEDNAEQLYDDQFIETCAEWVVPYIGDLVGARGLRDVRSAGFSARAYIANTLASRRRKGTAAMLEQLGHDLTHWSSAAVEMFLRLAWTQWLNHIRPECVVWFDLRDSAAIEQIGTPFDRAMRTVDVRRISSGRGLHNIPNVAIFLWRIGAYSLTNSPAVSVDAVRWMFGALGNDTPLYSHPEPEVEITHLATRANAPMPITRRSLAREPETWYGRSLLVHLAGTPVALQNIESCDLSGWPVWAHTPAPADHVAIDPRLGRLTLPDDPENVAIRIAGVNTPLTANAQDPLLYESSVDIPPDLDDYEILIGGVPIDRASIRMANEPAVRDTVVIDVAQQTVMLPAPPSPPRVTFHYGGVADANIGGGEYEREASFSGIDAAPEHPDPGQTIPAAVAAKIGGQNGILEIQGSGRYEDTLTFNVAAATQFELRAGNESRPSIVMSGTGTITGGDRAEITLNGLLISGGTVRIDGSPRLLRIRHCTLVPGHSLAHDGAPAQPGGISLRIDTAAPVTVEIESSVVGRIDMPADKGTLTIRDSMVASSDAAVPAISSASGYGPPSTIERCTIFGKVRLRELTLGSESIFTEPVTIERIQSGCVRFSYVAQGAKVPRPYKCVGPANAESVRLAFVSTKYGDAAYAQLAPSTAASIANGSEDGSEMGVYCALQSPRREANLRAALDEYLRFGLEAGIFHAS
jgi:hypothetical protein